MRKISSTRTFFLKRIFPAIWILAVVTIGVAALTQDALRHQPVVYIAPVAMLVAGIFAYRKAIWELADEVHDGGDFLKVRRGTDEENIPLTSIINVSAATQMNPPRITLRLAKPGIFGDEVVFSPPKPFSFNVFARNPTAEDLIIRVDAARRASVRR